MRHVHIPWLASMCAGAALLLGFAVFLSTPATASLSASNFSAAVAESTTPAVGVVLGASTDFSGPPSPLNCLSPAFFPSTAVVNGITTSSLCEPTARLAVFGISNGTTNEVNYLDEIGAFSKHRVCTKEIRFLGAKACYAWKYVLDVPTTWQQTSNNGRTVSAIILAGKTATLQWVFQPSQQIGWLQDSDTWFGASQDKNVSFDNLTYVNQTSGSWQSWSGSGTFVAGSTAGSVPVTPIDTTTYTLQGKNSGSVIGTISGTVYVDRPVLDLTASPSSVAAGSKVGLSWTAHNVNPSSCTITDDSSLVVASSVNGSAETGTVTTGPIQKETTYTMKCQRYSGGIASVSVTVPLAAPCANSPQSTGCYISATSPVLEGGSTTISWGCQSPEDSTYKVEQQPSSGSWTVLKQGSLGTKVLGINFTTNKGTINVANVFSATPYRLTCSPTGVQGNTTVITIPPDLSSFKATPVQVTSGNTSKLFWSATNVVANSCQVTGPGISTYKGNTNPAGGLTTSPITKSTTYTLTCATPASQTGRAAPKVTATVQVSVACGNTATAGSCYFFAKPSAISLNASSTLTWQCQSGDITAAITGNNGYSGGGSWANTASVSPTTTTNYSMLCSPSGAVGSTSVQVYQLNLSANPNPVRAGNTASITWNAGGAVVNSCKVTGTNGEVITSGSNSGTKTTKVITQPVTYTLSCTSLADGSTLKKSLLLDVIPAFKEI